MKKNNACSSVSFLTGVIAGALTGTLVGMLLAPYEGRSLRGMLGYRLKRYSAKLYEILEELAHQKSKQGNAAKANSQALVDSAVNKVEQLLADVNDLTTQVTNKS